MLEPSQSWVSAAARAQICRSQLEASPGRGCLPRRTLRTLVKRFVHGSATMIDYVKPIERLHGEFGSVMWLTQTLFIVAAVESGLIEPISRKQARHMTERLQDRRVRGGHVGHKYHQLPLLRP